MTKDEEKAEIVKTFDSVLDSKITILRKLCPLSCEMAMGHKMQPL